MEKLNKRQYFYAFIYTQLTILHQRYYWCYWQISSMAGTLFLAFIKELNHAFSHFSAPRHILHISPLLLFLLIPLPPALEAMTTCASGWGFHCIALNVSWVQRFLFEINTVGGIFSCQVFWNFAKTKVYDMLSSKIWILIKTKWSNVRQVNTVLKVHFWDVDAQRLCKC